MSWTVLISDPRLGVNLRLVLSFSAEHAEPVIEVEYLADQKRSQVRHYNRREVTPHRPLVKLCFPAECQPEQATLGNRGKGLSDNQKRGPRVIYEEKRQYQSHNRIRAGR